MLPFLVLPPAEKRGKRLLGHGLMQGFATFTSGPKWAYIEPLDPAYRATVLEKVVFVPCWSQVPGDLVEEQLCPCHIAVGHHDLQQR